MESWLPIIEGIVQDRQIQVDIVIPSPWVIAKLGSGNALAHRLQEIGVHFSFISGLETFRFKSFNLARAFAKLFNFILALRVFDKTTRILRPFLLLVPKTQWDLLPTSELHRGSVLSDIHVYYSQHTKRNEKFIKGVTGKAFFSLYHGTIHAGDYYPGKELVAKPNFQEIFIMSVGPRQTQIYVESFSGTGYRVVKSESPRLMRILGQTKDLSLIKKKKDLPAGAHSFLFLTRQPRELEDFSFWQALKSIRLVINALSDLGVGGLLLRPHPNQSHLSRLLFRLAPRLLPPKCNVKIREMQKRDEMQLMVSGVLTWSTGLVVDYQIAGIPAIELRGVGSGLGPPLQDAPVWELPSKLGLVGQVSDKSDLSTWLEKCISGTRIDYSVSPQLRGEFYFQTSAKSILTTPQLTALVAEKSRFSL